MQHFSRGILDSRPKAKKKNQAFDLSRARTPQIDPLAVIYGTPPTNFPAKKTKRGSNTSLNSTNQPAIQQCSTPNVVTTKKLLPPIKEKVLTQDGDLQNVKRRRRKRTLSSSILSVKNEVSDSKPTEVQRNFESGYNFAKSLLKPRSTKDTKIHLSQTSIDFQVKNQQSPKQKTSFRRKLFKEEPEVKLATSHPAPGETTAGTRWKHFIRLMDTEPKTHEQMLLVMNSKIVKLREKMQHHFKSVSLQEKSSQTVRFILSGESH